MNAIKTYPVLAAVLAVAAVLLSSACGGGGGDSNASDPAPEGSDATETVSTQSVDGVGEVLVDSNGAALYSADQETNRMILCTGSCAAIWLPLTLEPGEDSPTAGDGLAAELGVVTRPDGAEQVTFDGKPLYRFTEDTGPGVVTGDGFSDRFEGRLFTWQVASPDGASDGVSTPPGAPGYSVP
jgi:predicted lipoprotein with Yx(FWY)xxD motif